MKKLLLFFICAFLGFYAYPQLTLVPGQPADWSIKETIKVKDNLAFIFTTNYKVFTFDGYAFEEIDWNTTSPFFLIEYYGAINNKYYFKGDDLYEYDPVTKNVQIIPMPSGYPCKSSKLFANDVGNSIWFNCIEGSQDKAILAYDGTSFNTFDIPQNHSSHYFKFMYSSDLNQVLIWYHVNHSAEPVLYSFDGNTLKQIPKPNTDFKLKWPGDLYDNQVILTYEGYNEDNKPAYLLYKFDGTNLTEIPGLQKAYSQRSFAKAANKLYLFTYNQISDGMALYEYDGSVFSLVLDESYTYSISQYYGEMDGKEMFSMYTQPPLNEITLFSYDGTDFQEILGANDYQLLMYAGKIDDKMFLNYRNSSYQYDLYSYTAGDSQVEPVTNFPTGYIFTELLAEYDDFLLYHLRDANNVYKLFSYDETNQFMDIQPNNHSFREVEFELNNKIYLSLYDQIDRRQRLFVMDATLNTPDNNFTSNMVLYPNPVTDYAFIEIPQGATSQKFEVSVVSIDGKSVYKQSVTSADAALKIDLNSIKSGIYIVELKGGDVTLRTKLIKK